MAKSRLHLLYKMAVLSHFTKNLCTRKKGPGRGCPNRAHRGLICARNASTWLTYLAQQSVATHSHNNISTQSLCGSRVYTPIVVWNVFDAILTRNNLSPFVQGLTPGRCGPGVYTQSTVYKLLFHSIEMWNADFRYVRTIDLSRAGIGQQALPITPGCPDLGHRALPIRPGPIVHSDCVKCRLSPNQAQKTDCLKFRHK